MKAKVIIVAAGGELAACQRKLRQGERAPGSGCLALEPDIPETCIATNFVEVGKEAEGRPVHGVLEEDGSCTIEVMFAKTVICLDLGNV
jgi:hypothetical protein